MKKSEIVNHNTHPGFETQPLMTDPIKLQRQVVSAAPIAIAYVIGAGNHDS